MRLSVALPGPLSFVPGTLTSSLYTGPVSALSGTLYLSCERVPADLRRIAAVLAVYNAEAPVTLGLAPYTFQQDFCATLDGPAFSVGALQGR